MKDQSKSQPITKRMVYNAYLKVKENGGSAGVDRVSLQEYEENLANNLYKLWNRLTSGSYFPPAVKEVLIDKAGGGKRGLGIPTVGDRIAQTVVKQHLEPEVEPLCHKNSFGYRPGRSAHDALSQARSNCWKYAWVIDLDIRKFFDTLNHKSLMRIVELYTAEKWVLMYIERWLKAPLAKQDGSLEARVQGTPQGGVISPLLANLYLHHAFDTWMDKMYPNLPFERYADDIIIHCSSEKQARLVLAAVKARMSKCKLSLHPRKTKIVYCKTGRRKGKYPKVSFDFLGFTFKPRSANGEEGGFTTFSPGISHSAKKRFFARIRQMNIQNRTGSTAEDLSAMLNPYVQGFAAYFGYFRKSDLTSLFNWLNLKLVKWARRKYKGLKRSMNRSWDLLKRLHQSQPKLFRHWQLKPP